MRSDLPLVRVLDEGRRRHRAGDLDGAEACYRRCLDKPPVDTTAGLLLGQLLGQAGRTEEAEHLLRARLERGGPPARLLLARLLLTSGRPGEVLDVLEQAAVSGEPGGDIRETAERLGLSAEARVALGRPDEAARDLEQALNLVPGQPVFWNRLGVLRLRAGDARLAVKCFRQSLRFRPGHRGVRRNLAGALAEAGDRDGAGSCYRVLLEEQPGDPMAGIGYVNLLKDAGELAEAWAVGQRLVNTHPRNVGVLMAAGALAQASGQLDLAGELYSRALAAEPGHPAARAAAAELLEWQGQYGEALASLGEHRPGAPLAELLVRARLMERVDRPGEALALLDGHALGRDIAPERQLQRRRAFLRGDLLDRLGRYPEALAAWEAGNRLGEIPWDAAAHSRWLDRLATVPMLAPDGHSGGEGVVLIVGLPRSGTSLVEQMLAAHPAVDGGGERPALGRIARESSALADVLGAQDAGSLAAAFREAPVPAGRRFTDKMPVNFQYLRVAARVLPGARVLHCRRDLRDTAVSCFAQDFIDPALAFSRRWPWIEAYFRAYLDFMGRWRAAPGLPTHDIRYEDLVADPQAVLEGVLAFLELPWEPACLAFHQLDRTVHTASHAQVRRALYTDSVDRWRHYAPWLPPAVLDLVPGGVDHEPGRDT